MSSIQFALNHMCAPTLSIPDFFALAGTLNCTAVEIRNDLSGNAIVDGTPPEAIKAEAARAGAKIISINALQRFNEWTDARAAEASELIGYARRCGAEALVLVPTNDGSGLGEQERPQNLRRALAGLQPLLESAGIIGLVEPLGFESCSLRSKTEAVEAIRDLNADARFKLVHDTFHHHLAGEGRLHPEMTGLVHISGVEDASLPTSDMRDSHRLLVGPTDLIGNVTQITQLQAFGYRGYYSFEPFAAEVHSLASPATEIGSSIAFVRERVGAAGQ
jgi:2-keto-myo-inositol isomerase